MSKALSEGLTKETPTEYKSSLLAVQIRCRKSYPGQYHYRQFVYTEDEAEVFLVSNLKIKSIKIELEKTEFENFIQEKRDTGSMCGALMAWEDGNDWNLSCDDQCPHCNVDQPCTTHFMFDKYYNSSEWESRISDTFRKEGKP